MLSEYAMYKFEINCKFIQFLGKAPQTPSTLIRLNELIKNLTTDLTDHTEK
jgi:hypothetical protein